MKSGNKNIKKAGIDHANPIKENVCSKVPFAFFL